MRRNSCLSLFLHFGPVYGVLPNAVVLRTPKVSRSASILPRFPVAGKRGAGVCRSGRDGARPSRPRYKTGFCAHNTRRRAFSSRSTYPSARHTPRPNAARYHSILPHARSDSERISRCGAARDSIESPIASRPAALEPAEHAGPASDADCSGRWQGARPRAASALAGGWAARASRRPAERARGRSSERKTG